VTLAGVDAPYVVTPLWQWALGFGSGHSLWPWRPYAGQGGPAVLLGPEATALSAGSGTGGLVRYEVLESSPDKAVFRGTTADGIEVVEQVSAGGDPCVLTAELSWKNTGAGAFSGPLWLGLYDRLDVPATGWFAGQPKGQLPKAYIDGSLVQPQLGKLVGPLPETGPVDWFALTGTTFGFFVLPGDPAAGQLTFDRRGEPVDGRADYGATWAHAGALAPGETFTASFRVYGGRLDKATLAAVAPPLTKVINYGWMAAFASPMLVALELIHSWVGNWGVAIVLLTVAIKILLFPVINSGMKSSMKMAALQPKLQEIRATYKDEPEEMNRRTMALFAEGGANPLGGCLPLLLQIPVFASLYGVLLTSADLYHGQFLYLRDLSAPDPYMVLPLLTVALMWGQQQLTPMTNIDPSQAQILKLMPFMFGLFFFTAPSGLGVYMFVNISLSILQQWWIKRQFPQPTPASAPA
jgi:YidC/Oxa1 family membrane protein insertase